VTRENLQQILDLTIISGAAISPDGSQNANLITLFPSAPNGYFGYLTSAGSYANKTLVFSMFLKLGTLTSTVTLYLRDSIGNSYGMAIFDLNAGIYVSGGVGAWGIVSAGSGFWRVYVSCTFPAGAGAGIACLVDPNDESANQPQKNQQPQHLSPGLLKFAVCMFHQH
jgi:hypothetical protein